MQSQNETKTVPVDYLHHHPLRDKIFGKEWPAAASRRIADITSAPNIEILPNGTVVYGNDDLDALIAIGAKKVTVTVRHDLKSGQAAIEWLAQNATYKGFQSAVEKFKAELACAGHADWLDIAEEGECLCENCLEEHLGHAPIPHQVIMLQACGLRGPLGDLLHAGVLSPAVAARARELSPELLDLIAQDLDVIDRRIAGDAFEASESVIVEHAVLEIVLADVAMSGAPDDSDSCPLDEYELGKLMEYLEGRLSPDCDGSIVATESFLEDNDLPAEDFLDWLDRIGVECDHAVLQLVIQILADDSDDDELAA